MFEIYTDVLKNKYAAAEGRASRREYWMFFLANVIISFVIAFAGGLIRMPFLASIYALAVMVPGICVGIRRLHDTGRSGWWLLLGLTGIGGIVLLVFYCMEGDMGSNAYGPNPYAFGSDGRFSSGRTQVSWHADTGKRSGDNAYNANPANEAAVKQTRVTDPEPIKSEPVWIPEDDGPFDDEQTAAFFEDEKTMFMPDDDDEKTVALLNDKPAMVKLTRLSDNNVINCFGDAFSVGKSHKSANYAVTDNEKVSRKHAEFYLKDDQYYLVDCSTNGTRVNGVAAEKGASVPVNDGDMIEFADEGFFFNINE